MPLIAVGRLGVGRLRDHRRRPLELGQRVAQRSARSVPSPYGRCFVSLRFANWMSEKWMWNGAPGSSTASALRERLGERLD